MGCSPSKNDKQASKETAGKLMQKTEMASNDKDKTTNDKLLSQEKKKSLQETETSHQVDVMIGEGPASQNHLQQLEPSTPNDLMKTEPQPETQVEIVKEQPDITKLDSNEPAVLDSNEKEDIQSLSSFKPELKTEATKEMVSPQTLSSQKNMLVETMKNTCDVEEFVKKDPCGLYLVFDSVNHGTFLAKYSKEFIHGALAFARPSVYCSIPPYKFKTAQVAAAKVQVGKENYLQAWASWLKEAKLLEAEIVLLLALDDKEQEDPTKFPSFKIYGHSDTVVNSVQRGLYPTPFNMKYIDAIACVPQSYKTVDDAIKLGNQISRKDFLAKLKGSQVYSYLEF